MNFIQKYYKYLTAFFVFVIYIITLAPSVVQIDSGELAAVQCTLGIAHPTGYPLFTMIGYLFSNLLFPFREIVALNLLSAVYCTTAVFIFMIIVDAILQKVDFNFPRQKKLKKKDKKLNEETADSPNDKLHIRIAAVIFGGLALVFSSTFWLQSTSVEVYSLHVLLIMLVVHRLVKIYFTGNVPNKEWYIFAVLLALGFTNHMTTILIIPSTAFVFFTKEKFGKQSFVRIFKMLGVFFPVLALVYLYLPIRASMNPLLNWGNPVNWENFLRHVSGKQYQVWLFSSFDSAAKQFDYFVSNLTSEFNVFLLLIALVGLGYGIKHFRSIMIFLLISFVFTVAYSINYDINDIDSYFLLAYISISFFIAIGSYFLFQKLSLQKYGYFIGTMSAVCVVGFHIYNNFAETDQSDKYIFEDYTKALINSTDENSIILSYQWDYFLSASYYFQHVEDFRPDVKIIDKELLRRSWYYNQLENMYPGLFDGFNNYVDDFLIELKPFEQDEKFDAARLEELYRKIMTNLVAKNIVEHNFYIGPELYDNEMKRGEFSLPEGYTIVPHQFLFKVTDSNEYVPAPAPDFQLRFPSTDNRYTNFIKQTVASMLTYRAAYEMQFGFEDKARLYIDKVKSINPNLRLQETFNSIK